ncbi:hypothetical protein AMECASPLE_001367 [Ameca splendens]|uniref:Uncharacterized protein n=1 Tax=Ameca splendens TaxID=208324 RepID=A0ABV1A551_9TELE
MRLLVSSPGEGKYPIPLFHPPALALYFPVRRQSLSLECHCDPKNQHALAPALDSQQTPTALDFKAQLEAEGHTAVQPSEFFLGEDSSSSLLIILRNEDIAEHICKIPDLLKLKMTPGVLFAGIDEPDDVLNLTHQELFTRAGFVMFDRAVLEPLSICNMKKISKNLEELSRMGKWKWMLHYRDSRRLKENARLSEEANQKKLFVYWCQDAGILEVLPYHECDQMTRDQPDYLECLLRLQVQHISSRFPVFITGKKV